MYGSRWFWLGIPLLEKLLNSMGTLISGYAILEIVCGRRSLSVNVRPYRVSPDAGIAVLVCAHEDVDAHLNLDRLLLVKGDHHACMEVVNAYLVAYSFKLFSCVFVLLLSRQKADA